MNAKFIRALPLAMMLLFSPFCAKADTTASLVVVEKDGTIVETPIPDVSRIDFDTFSFSVLTKDGNSEKHDYDSVNRIEFGKTTGIALPAKDVRLAVWPTVTSTTLNVTGTEANDMIYVFGLNGTQELSVTASDDVNVIDVSGLPSGHYILKAGNTSVRFIKK